MASTQVAASVACSNIGGLTDLTFGAGGSPTGASGDGGLAGAGGLGGAGGAGGGPLTIVFGDNSDDDVKFATADTTIAEAEPTMSFGSSDDVQIDAGSDVRRALLRFDLGTTVDGATIESATLRLRTPSSTGDSPLDFPISPVLEAWNEATATWLMRTALDPWSLDGCGTPTSCSVEVVGTYRPLALSSTYDVPIDAAIVQDWVDGAQPNFGLMIQLISGSDGGRFCSREDADGERPRLVVTYQL